MTVSIRGGGKIVKHLISFKVAREITGRWLQNPYIMQESYAPHINFQIQKNKMDIDYQNTPISCGLLQIYNLDNFPLTRLFDYVRYSLHSAVIACVTPTQTLALTALRKAGFKRVFSFINKNTDNINFIYIGNKITIMKKLSALLGKWRNKNF